MAKNPLFGVIYKSTVLLPKSSLNSRFVIGMRKCNSVENFKQSGYIGSSKLISRVVKKYGKDCIKTDIVYMMFDNSMDEIIKRKQLGEWEKHFIKLYDSQNPKIGLNLTMGGDGGNTLLCLSEKEKQKRNIKISKNNAHYSRKRTEEEKRKNRELHLGRQSKMKGRKMPVNHSINTSKGHLKYYKTHDGPNKGKKFSEEWKTNLKFSFQKRVYNRICKKCSNAFTSRSSRKSFCKLCEVSKHE
jgi:hypothetical protein